MFGFRDPTVPQVLHIFALLNYHQNKIVKMFPKNWDHPVFEKELNFFMIMYIIEYCQW